MRSSTAVSRRDGRRFPCPSRGLQLLLCALCAFVAQIGATPAAVPLIAIQNIDPSIRVELRYNGTNNIFKRRFYRSNVAMLRIPVAQRLARVQARLRRQGLGLKIWDAYRPRSVQYALWKVRPGTRFLANPRKGSKHSRGAAVDLTLVDADGRELKMPTPHDEFSPRARRGATRGISKEGRKNGLVLDAAMRAEGFLPNRGEWWHFDAPDWRKYPLSDAPLPSDPR